MRIRFSSSCFAVFLATSAVSGCEGKATPRDIDAVWNDLTSEERVAYLEEELEVAEEKLKEARDLEAWDAAHQRALAVLSLLRPEIWPEERERFLVLEATLDELARDTHDAL